MAHIIKPAVCKLTEVQAQNTAGGTAATGAWTTRTLNTIDGESWFLESLSSSVFQLAKGMYRIRAHAPFYRTGNTRIRIYQTGGANESHLGGSYYFNDAAGTNNAHVEAIIYVTSGTASERQWRLEYRTPSLASSSTSNLGNATNISGLVEVYSTVMIEKLK
tara:strand:- start:1072 stop:1557 length:486 start_codon:yes stop_codon:yes gene_type:complete